MELGEGSCPSSLRGTSRPAPSRPLPATPRGDTLHQPAPGFLLAWRSSLRNRDLEIFQLSFHLLRREHVEARDQHRAFEDGGLRAAETFPRPMLAHMIHHAVEARAHLVLGD